MTSTELLLRGTVSADDYPRTLLLLRALCPQAGDLGEFREHETVYHARAGTGRGVLRVVQTWEGTEMDETVRSTHPAPRCTAEGNLDDASGGAAGSSTHPSILLIFHVPGAFFTREKYQTAPFVVKHFGALDRRKELFPCQKRTVTSTLFHTNPASFLSTLGYSPRFDFLRAGRRFATRHGLAVHIYTVAVLPEPGKLHSGARVVGGEEEGLGTGPARVVDIVRLGEGGAPQDLTALAACLPAVALIKAVKEKGQR